MTRSAAAKANEAADALVDWLRTQPRAAVRETPSATDVIGFLVEAVSADKAIEDPAASAGASVVPGMVDTPDTDDIALGSRALPALGQDKSKNGAPLRLAHTDWLHHRLTICGPEHHVAAFRAAAAGAGTIPWQFDLDRMEEDFFHLLVSPPPPQRRTLSLTGARILAGQLREAVARRHDLAMARVGSRRAGAGCRACPFDLHALVPVPDGMLRLGPDDPAALSWLWENWGTTQALRHVVQDAATGADDRRRPPPGAAVFRIEFWSADWTPWRALTRIAGHWKTLRFDMRPTYDPP